MNFLHKPVQTLHLQNPFQHFYDDQGNYDNQYIYAWFSFHFIIHKKNISSTYFQNNKKTVLNQLWEIWETFYQEDNKYRYLHDIADLCVPVFVRNSHTF